MANGKNTASKIVEFPNADGKKLIVLDTSVLLHDPESLFRFKDNDVYLPRQVLAQLDRHKKGQSDNARNARQVSRTIEAIFRGSKKLLQDGASMAEASHGAASGKLFYQTEALTSNLPKNLLDDEADRQIIGVACALRRERKAYTEVVLVTKDVNMRYAALGFVSGNIAAEDYLNDKVLLKDSDVLPTGYHKVSKDFWDAHDVLESGKAGHHDFWRVRGPMCQQLVANECLYIEDDKLLVRVRKHLGREIILESITDYHHAKNAVWGISARNIQQSMAFGHLMDPEIDLTALLGPAGTGKSLLALAAGFAHLPGLPSNHPPRHQHDDKGEISEIILTRAMVPVGGEDLGYLPGTVDEKFGPWMVALEDTKEALFDNAIKLRLWNEAVGEKQREAIKIQPISLIAGRTLANKFVIVDEAQNLTPYQAKMLVTRAGEGSRFVFCGNLSQIDTPFLDEKGSGLASLVMKMRGHERVAHVILEECVRSPLAALAVERL